MPIAGLAFTLAALSFGVAAGAPTDKAASETAAETAPGAPWTRGDADGDGVSDALAARLLAAASGEFFDVIVVFDGPRAAARAREVAGPFQIEREFQIIHGFQATLPAPAIWALSRAPGLVRIQENGEVRAFDLPSNDDTGVATARASHLVDGDGVTVCVLDTGINPNHEMFDTRTWNPGDFMDFTPNNIQSPYDDQGHGSHVSGILAGDGVGAETVIAPQAEGVAPGVTLRVGKVLSASGTGSDAQVIAGIEWCASVGEIISMSLGDLPTDGSDALSLAANCAADPTYSASCGNTDAAIVVVSAGNSGAEPSTVGTPGVAQNAITVGSFAEWSGEPGFGWQDDGVYLNPFSSRGPVVNAGGATLWMKPDVVGPGSRVLSAYINSADPAAQLPDYYAVADGTSMSTPFVAGVIALMLDADPSLGVWDQTGPDNRLPHEKVRELLALTSVDVGPPGQDNEYGHGLVDAMAAVSAALGSPGGATDYPLLPPIVDTIADNGTWTYEFTVSQDFVDQQLPISATLTIPNGACNNGIYEPFFGDECLAGISWWDPDLEMIAERHLGGSNWQQVVADVDPVSNIGEVTISECPARGECWNSVGRVEVVHFIPNVAGLYRIRVWPSADPGSNNGTGGDFSFEFSMFDAAPPVDTPPTAAFTSLCTNLDCDFTDASTDEGSVVGWSWNFGDGNTSTAQNPSHSYAAGGTYTVTLTATDDSGQSDDVSQGVTVSAANVPPTASFTYSCTDRTCVFTDTSEDGDGTLTAWDWDFGDLNGSVAQNPTYTYSGYGDFTVTLTVTDDDDATNAASQPITLIEPPVGASVHVADLDGASAPAPKGRWVATVTIVIADQDDSVVSGATVDGFWSDGTSGGASCVTEADGSCWVDKQNLKGNVSGVTFNVSNVTFPGATYSAADNTDPESDSDGTTIVVFKDGAPANQPPTAAFGWDCTPTTATSCAFTDASGDSDGMIVSWSWDFGGGNTSTAQNPIFDFGIGGSYPVTLTVTDDAGATDSDTQTVSVGSAPPADITLSVFAEKVKGIKTVSLTWSGATSADVDIRRDGAIIETSANDGAFTETLGKGGGTYTYQVCEAGTSTCSPTADAVF